MVLLARNFLSELDHRLQFVVATITISMTTQVTKSGSFYMNKIFNLLQLKPAM